MAEPTEVEKEKQRYLVAACFHDLALAKQILAADPQAVHCRNGPGETAFSYVVVENRIDLAEFLLEAGSDINSADLFGSTPLIHAVRLGYDEIVRWLVDRGASLDSKTINEDTALSLSTSEPSQKIFDYLIGLKRNHPISYYFDDHEAKSILSDPDHPMREVLIQLGLEIPDRMRDDSE